MVPKLGLKAFSCPQCHVCATQSCFNCGYNFISKYLFIGTTVLINTLFNDKDALSKYGALSLSDLRVSRCENFQKVLIWNSESILFPRTSVAPIPTADTPEDVRRIFEEARQVFEVSPRGSSALLRLALQMLCVHLGEPGVNINADIGSLVKKGLSVEIQQALDTLRVIGNEAVHPGEVLINERPEDALILFGVLNLVAERMISHPKRLSEMYKSLHERALKGIESRDKKAKEHPKS